MNDPIVEQVRRVRDVYAARFHYDLDAIYRDIKEQEKKSGRKLVSFASANAEPYQEPQPTGTAILVPPDSPSAQAATTAERGD